MKKPNVAVLVGQAIREGRTALGVTQDEFADKIKMHRAQYSAIERGENNITLNTLHRVARGLGVSMASLLNDVDG